MKPETTLDKINSEEHVNEIISRDEENPVKENAEPVRLAEELILQLPPSEQRNRWLAAYGQSPEAERLRKND